VGFGRRDFGNQQAKSEALQRVFAFDDSLAIAAQHVQRLSGLDHVAGSPSNTPAGLGNWDNSCYQNSILQSLASLSSFDDYLAQNVGRMFEHEDSSTHDALRNIISGLNHVGNEGKRLWTPSVLKSMNSWQQQDAQEYFSRIIDEVDRELSRVVKDKTTELGLRHHGDDATPSNIWQHNPFQGSLAQRVGCTRCGYTEGLSLLPFTCITVNLGMQLEHDVRDCLDEYTALESIEGVECIKCTILRTKASLEHVLSNIDIRDASKPAVQAEFAPASTLRNTVTERLQVINEVCEAGDFSDSSLYKKCTIPARSRVSSTKSKQAVIARAPKDLVIHINRSIFDATGFQRKNHARVRFPSDLDLKTWCLGADCVDTGKELLECWNVSPTSSMLPEAGAENSGAGKLYKLRAVITHYGGHENGHYIAYRKRSPSAKAPEIFSTDAKGPDDSWFSFSDDVVSSVSEDHVLSQGGVFMLFYEAVTQTGSVPETAAHPVVPERPTATREATQAAPLEGDHARILPEGAPEIDHIKADSPQTAQSVVPSSDAKSPTSSTPPAQLSSSLEEACGHSNAIVQPEPVRMPPVAPVMRTAGALSPNARNGRRSSNISIHSPSFVTAS
jgi:ubiquitin carboxyl-terminal hydrolase 1